MSNRRNDTRGLSVEDLFGHFRDSLSVPRDVYLAPKIPPEKKSNARSAHRIDIHTPIYVLVDHTFFGSAKNSLLMTEDGLSYHKDGDFHTVEWAHIHHVKVIDDRMVLYGDEDEQQYDDSWGLGLFGLSGTSRNEFPKYLKRLQNLLNALAQNVENPLDELYESIRRAEEREDWETVIDAGRRSFAHNEYNLKVFELVAEAHFNLGQYEEVEAVARAGLDKVGELETQGHLDPHETQDALSAFLAILGLAQLQQDNPYDSLFPLQGAETFVPSSRGELKKRITRGKNLAIEKLSEQFTDLSSERRSVICFTTEIPESYPEEFIVLPESVEPDLNFPLGKPSDGNIMVAHPYRENTYYPFDKHEEYLQREKFLELSRLLQCLGAKKIEVKGKTRQIENVVESLEESVGGEGRVGLVGAGGQKTTAQNRDTHQASGFGAGVTQTFEPLDQEPFVPDDLVWFQHQPSWQQLAKQRLHGQIRTHSMNFSTRDIRVVGEHRREKIAAELQTLKLGVGAGAVERRETTTSQNRAKTFQLDVLFYTEGEVADESSASATKVAASSDSMNTSAKGTEQIPKADAPSPNPYVEDYSAMLRDALEDGAITSSEERILERMRNRWEISEKRAEELENEIRDEIELDSDEQAYREDVEFCLENGQISEGERRLLDRRASQLGIDEERAKNIEALVKKQLQAGGKDHSGSN